MQCNHCKEDMDLIDRYDTGSNGNEHGKAVGVKEFRNICFNLYLCSNCGAVCKEDVWDNSGEIWLYENNSIDIKPDTRPIVCDPNYKHLG